MRIAMIGHKRITSFEGGIEKTVLQLSEYMIQKGHQVTVYDRNLRQKEAKPSRRRALPERLRGIKIIKIPTLKGAAEVPLYSFLAAVHAAFCRYDVVIFHASGPSLMLPIVKAFGKKTVAFIHGIDSQRSKWGRFAKFYLRKGEQTAAKCADALLVLSVSNRNYLKKKYGRDGIMVFNGVEKPKIPEESDKILEKYGLEPGKYILFSGRVSKEKGLHYLIPAYLKINPEEKLVIAGKADTKHAEYYRKLQKLCNESSNIIFTGNLSQGELTALYSGASLFVLPSELEGMPHSLLEALSCGAPCLLSDISENRAVAGKHAVYFRSKDTRDLYKKLKFMLNNPEKTAELAKGEAEEVLKRYDLKKSAEQITKICERLAVSGK